jgi:leucine-rich repeat kinase 2
MERFERTILCFDAKDVIGNIIAIDEKMLIDLIPESLRNSEEYDFTYSKCLFCQKTNFNSFSPVSIDEKLSISYSMCVSNLGIHSGDPYHLSESQTVNLTEQFPHKFKNLKYLGVINHRLQLEKSEKFFLEFNDLLRVDFENNEWKEVPSSLIEMNSLMSLNLRRNPIKSFFKDEHSVKNPFEKLNKLKVLELEDLSIDFGKFKTNKIKLPNSLTTLHFKSFAIDDLPFDFDQCRANIDNLAVVGVKWIDLNEYKGWNETVSMENLFYFYLNIIGKEKCTKLFNQFDSNKKGYLNKDDVIQLNSFVFKKFARLGSEVVSGSSGIPQVIFTLENLTSLDLSFQAIRYIPDEIEKLRHLKNLNVSYCILLESLSHKLSNLDIKQLNVDRCVSLKTPPQEICRRGTVSILAYLKRLNSGSVLCKRTKLMLVGLGEAGKTSLIHALINKNGASRPVITDGIEIREWSVDLPDKSQLTYSIWDFAGQSLYYNTHQFFLSPRGVYLLVWNVRLGSEYAGLDFWLNSISCHAPDAPVFVVGTHIDEVVF